MAPLQVRQGSMHAAATKKQTVSSQRLAGAPGLARDDSVHFSQRLRAQRYFFCCRRGRCHHSLHITCPVSGQHRTRTTLPVGW